MDIWLLGKEYLNVWNRILEMERIRDSGKVPGYIYEIVAKFRSEHTMIDFQERNKKRAFENRNR